MANALTVLKVVQIKNQKTVTYSVVLSGNYVQAVQGTAAGEALNLNAAANPGFIPGANWGLTGPKYVRTVTDGSPDGLAADVIPGIDRLHPLLKLWTANDTELAAGAYSAAEKADTNLILEAVGGPTD